MERKNYSWGEHIPGLVCQSEDLAELRSNILCKRSLQKRKPMIGFVFQVSCSKPLFASNSPP